MTQTKYIRLARAAEIQQKDVETVLIEAIEGSAQLFVMLHCRWYYRFISPENMFEDWNDDGQLPGGTVLQLSPEVCSAVLLKGSAKLNELGDVDGRPIEAAKISGPVEITVENIFLLSADVSRAARSSEPSPMATQKPMPVRAETTYQNIIAALLAYIAGDVPGVDRHPSYSNERALIRALAEHFQGYGGLSESNLSRKLPEAKRSLENQ